MPDVFGKKTIKIIVKTDTFTHKTAYYTFILMLILIPDKQQTYLFRREVCV